jgi:cytochrome c-type biogenesis protein
MFDSAGVGALAAFFAGIVSFLSPCVLPLVPAYVSYMAGTAVDGVRTDPGRWQRLRAVLLSFWFVLGFSTVFVTLGASATALGQLVLSYRYELNLIGGAIVILFGLFMLGMARLRVLQRELRFHPSIRGGRPASTYILGLAFGFGWTPCIGPILGAILTVSAVSTTVGEGVALLAIYSAGLGVPFVLAAACTDRLARRIRTLGQFGRRLYQGAGIVMVVMGIAMITGHLSSFAYWILDTFPILGRIG